MRHILDNKKAKTGPGLTVFWIVIAVLIVGLIGWLAMGTQQSVERQEEIASDCEIAPSISASLVDAINPGTAVGADVTAVKNGKYIGAVTSSTSFGKGDKVDLMFNTTGYIDIVGPSFELECGSNSVEGELYKTSAASMRLFNTNNDLLTNNIAGGANNQSTGTGADNLALKIDSKSDESTGDLIIVIEADNTTAIDDVKIAGANEVSEPDFYSPGAGSVVKAYEVAAVNDGSVADLTLIIEKETSQTGAGTSINVTAYSKQAYIEKDGTIQVGIEDVDGNQKFSNAFGYAFSYAYS